MNKDEASRGYNKMKTKGKLIAKMKFWVGQEIENLFNQNYIIEYSKDRYFVYVYEVTKE